MLRMPLVRNVFATKFIRYAGFALCAAVLLGSGGVILINLTGLVQSSSNSSMWRWEPTSAAGSTWVHAWLELGSAYSYVSSWNAQSLS